MGIEYIERHEWGAMEPRSVDPDLDLPVFYVGVMYITAQANLEDRGVVLDTLRELQRRDMFNGMGDIRSNFYIASDGEVYEGRGWTTKPGNPNEYPGKEGEFLEICFLGDFTTEEFKHPIFLAKARLLDMGIKRNYIHRKAKFLGLDEGNFLPDSTVERPIYLEPPPGQF